MSPKALNPNPPNLSGTPAEPTKTSDQPDDSPEVWLQPNWFFPDFLEYPPPRGPNDPPPKFLPIQDVPLSEIDDYWEWCEQNPWPPKENKDEAPATSSPKPEAPETKSES